MLSLDQSGVALFMVIAAVAVLTVLVTEFVYTSQLNEKMASGGLDQVRAHYLARTGLKISLLRLKAYQNVENAIQSIGKSTGNTGVSAMFPKSLIEKIWDFPFIYPIPTDVPGITSDEKDSIEAFEKASSLDGTFTATIESESSKYNLNSILAPFAPSGSTGVTGPSGPQTQSPPPPVPNGVNPAAAGVSGPSGFNVDVARQALGDYLRGVLQAKFDTDQDFAAEYRDFRLDDLMDSLIAWADRNYQRHQGLNDESIPDKGAPYYSVSELHMIQGMDDRLYEVFAPTLTASITPGLDINTMTELVLRALVPQMTKDEADAFFKYRDDPSQDNLFHSQDDFFKYLLQNVQAFHGDQDTLNQFKQTLTSENIRLVTDETNFKITVRAQYREATSTIEAWVTLEPPSSQGTTPTPGGAANPYGYTTQSGGAQGANPTNPNDLTNQVPSSGLRITFMRIS